MKEPNFFIVGAPKCGTTSIAEWLRQHPQAFVSNPKELDYFDQDHRKRFCDSWARYKSYFSCATEAHIAVGEASVGYLRSKVAIPKILRLFPRARLVVCVRNPVSMALSWHNQMLNTGWETARAFLAAWNLQAERLAGRRIPKTCPDPSNLIYREVCAVGTQLTALFSIVPASQVHPIVLDDLIASPREVYLALLAFLGLPDDGREDFSAENTGRRLPRTFAVTARLAVDVKQMLGIRRGLGVITRLARIFEKSGIDAVGERELDMLSRHFEVEIKMLEDLLERDFSHWRAVRPSGVRVR